MRTELTFLEGTPGDNHLVYTYLENGIHYKVVENADANFIKINSITYVMNAEGDYVEDKFQELDIQPNDDCYLTTTDSQGTSKTSHIDTFADRKSVNTLMETNQASVYRAYTDPGTGEWITKVWDGSSSIYNMTVSAISAVLGAALGGKIGAAIGAIAAEFFKKVSDYAYYHVVDNWMMSKLYTVTVVIRESTHTTYYLDSKHKYTTGTDYYEYDGRW
ncbi:hypothetical protein ACA346_05110 [Streptococcus parasuis]|uniref:hypothetical protein n=1 Tax=Streptococcus parasuis TaxID=1501662 RepID=UPI003AAB293E